MTFFYWSQCYNKFFEYKRSHMYVIIGCFCLEGSQDKTLVGGSFTVKAPGWRRSLKYLASTRGKAPQIHLPVGRTKTLSAGKVRGKQEAAVGSHSSSSIPNAAHTLCCLFPSFSLPIAPAANCSTSTATKSNKVENVTAQKRRRYIWLIKPVDKGPSGSCFLSIQIIS